MAVVKMIEVMGTSEDSWEDAVKNALNGAKKSIHGISGIEVVSQTAAVMEGELKEFRATVKIAFKVD